MFSLTIVEQGFYAYWIIEFFRRLTAKNYDRVVFESRDRRMIYLLKNKKKIQPETYEDEVLDEVRYSSVRDDEEPGDRSRNRFRWFLHFTGAVRGTSAARHQLQTIESHVNAASRQRFSFSRVDTKRESGLENKSFRSFLSSSIIVRTFFTFDV